MIRRVRRFLFSTTAFLVLYLFVFFGVFYEGPLTTSNIDEVIDDFSDNIIAGECESLLLRDSEGCGSLIQENIAKGRWLDLGNESFTRTHLDLKRVLLVIYFNDPLYVSAAKNYALYHR